MDYSSASFDIKYSSTQPKTHKIEEIITNAKMAELIFNSPKYDTLKVLNIYEPDDEEEESKYSESDISSGFSSSISSMSEQSISSLDSLLSNSVPDTNMPINENLLITLTNLEFLKKISKSSIVEVLFILSKLMFGSKKLQVQKKLHKAGIIGVVHKLYSLLLKTMDTLSPGQDMKIQILKLVINYLSRDAPNLENKLE